MWLACHFSLANSNAVTWGNMNQPMFAPGFVSGIAQNMNTQRKGFVALFKHDIYNDFNVIDLLAQIKIFTSDLFWCDTCVTLKLTCKIWWVYMLEASDKIIKPYFLFSHCPEKPLSNQGERGQCVHVHILQPGGPNDFPNHPKSLLNELTTCGEFIDLSQCPQTVTLGI